MAYRGSGFFSGGGFLSGDGFLTGKGWEQAEEEERLRRLLENASSTSSSSTSSSDSFRKRTQSEIDNTKLRLEAMGKKPKDNRSFLEKLFNLPDDQNWFFDTLEVLGRPGQAITNIIDGAQKKSGKGVFKEAWEGLSGKEKVSGTDILRNMGWTDQSIENRHKTKLGEWGEKVARGVTGFAVDVLTDPFTYAGGAVFKAAGAGAKATAKGVDNVLSNNAFYQKAKQATQNVGDELGRIFNTTNRRGMDGTKSDFLNKVESTMRAGIDYDTTMIFDAAKNAMNRLGDLDKGKQLTDYVESPFLMENINKQAKKIALDEKKVYNANINEAKNELKELVSGLPKEWRKPKFWNKLDDKEKFQILETFYPFLEKKDFDRLFTPDLYYGKFDEYTAWRTVRENLINEQMKKNPPSVLGRSDVPKNERKTFVEAHQTLKSMLDVLKERAKKLGSEFVDTYGDSYVPHVMTKEALEMGLRPDSYMVRINRAGNKERTLKDTIQNINHETMQKYGVKMFEDNAIVAFAEKMKQMSRAINAEEMKRSLLSNPNFARKLADDEFVPKNSNLVEVDFNEYQFLEGAKPIEGRWVVTKDVKRLLDDTSKRLKNDSVKGFLDAYDKVHNLWKSSALFSVGFHARNFLGNNFNMWLAGMSPKSLIHYQKQAMEDLSKIKELKQKPRNQLTPEEQKIVLEYEDFLKQGLRENSIYELEFKTQNTREAFEKQLKESNKTVKDKLKESVKNPIKGIKHAFDASQSVGFTMDTWQRYAMYKWAKEKTRNSTKASMLVRQYLFDYNDLSKVEREVFKRVVPFYTWIRKNAALQLTNFLKDPEKYYRTSEAFKNAFDTMGMDEDEVDKYHVEKWNIPVGENKMLAANLPLSDVPTLTKPLETFKEVVSPLIKLPLELPANYDFFREKPIEEFEGQTKPFYPLPGVEVEAPAKLSHILNNIGALRNYSRNNQDLSEGNLFDVLTGNMVKTVDPDQISLQKLLEEREKVRGQAKRFEQETGQKLPTLDELIEMGLIQKDKNGNYTLADFLPY